MKFEILKFNDIGNFRLWQLLDKESIGKVRDCQGIDEVETRRHEGL